MRVVIPGEVDGPVLLAVSGGIDSMCMADLFLRMEPSVPFAVAHCNFRLRGEESDGDEALVREWSREHDVQFFSTSFDTEKYAAERGVSIEMAARDLRYSWFADLCLEHGFAATAVAHNANDNAETLILNLLRGTGLKGLTGMAAVSNLPCGSVSGPFLIRPLLSFTRKQIEGYVYSHGIAYREDRTNALSDYKRNRIRNEIFPLFEKINPSFVRTLNREMKYLAEAEDVVTDWCRDASALPDIAGTALDMTGGKIGISGLLAQSHWRYLLYYMLEPYGFNSAVLASVESLLVSERTLAGKRFVSDTHMLFTTRDSLVVVPASSCFPADTEEQDEIHVAAPGIFRINGRTVRVEEVQWTSDMPLKQPEGVLVMDADRLRAPFILRKWQAGDWLVPFGMRGRKKVSDIFADLKFDLLQKESSVMVVDPRDRESSGRQRIAAVAGIRIDDRYRVNRETVRVWRIII